LNKWSTPSFRFSLNPGRATPHRQNRNTHDNGYLCVPIIIAESWAGDLKSLKCEHLIYLKTNPNQLDEVQKLLAKALDNLLPVWKQFLKGKS